MKAAWRKLKSKRELQLSILGKHDGIYWFGRREALYKFLVPGSMDQWICPGEVEGVSCIYTRSAAYSSCISVGICFLIRPKSGIDWGSNKRTRRNKRKLKPGVAMSLFGDGFCCATVLIESRALLLTQLWLVIIKQKCHPNQGRRIDQIHIYLIFSKSLHNEIHVECEPKTLLAGLDEASTLQSKGRQP